MHPSALSINEMHVGRQIIAFSCFYGILFQGRIHSESYVKGGEVMIDVMYADGSLVGEYLGDIGVIRLYDSDSDQSRWSFLNFVIDARKQALLPEVLAAHPVSLEWYGSLDYPFDPAEDYYEISERFLTT